MYKTNPITRMDYPSPDVIRVEDTYYMLCATLHFKPGGVILRSYNLQHWETAGYLYDGMGNTENECMMGECTDYGHGMERGCLRYHKGNFYALFYVRGCENTFLYTAENAEGPWKKGVIEGKYLDGCLLFDEDDRAYVVYGEGSIYLTELKDDMSGPKTEAAERVLLAGDGEEVSYSEAHLYRIQNKYGLFVTKGSSELCLEADSLTDEWRETEIVCDDADYQKRGLTGGCVVETMNHKWYAVTAQNYGAAGRIPVLIPISFQNGQIICGRQGKIPARIEPSSSRPYYRYESLYGSDSFQNRLKKHWQWNHEPVGELWKILPEGGFAVKTGKVSTNVLHAQNMLTQRMLYPESSAEVVVDASNILEGDVTGICVLHECYGLVGVTKVLKQYYLVVIVRNEEGTDYLPGIMVERIKIDSPVQRLRISANLASKKETAEFFYETEEKWERIGKKHKLCGGEEVKYGCRYGLFTYATGEIGGKAVFHNFLYH